MLSVAGSSAFVAEGGSRSQLLNRRSSNGANASESAGSDRNGPLFGEAEAKGNGKDSRVQRRMTETGLGETNNQMQAGYNTTVSNVSPDGTADPVVDDDFTSAKQTAGKAKNKSQSFVESINGEAKGKDEADTAIRVENQSSQNK